MGDMKNLTIKEWNADDRPREKMLAKGISALSDAELLAILISTGTKSLSALDLARAVLQSAGNNLNQLGKFTVADLLKTNGIGKAKAVTIMAALELGRRRQGIDREQIEIKSSIDAFNVMQPIVGDLPHEEFWVLFLNTSNRLIDKACVGRGGINATTVDVRIVMKMAVEKLAASLLLVHNHPSGSLTPSAEDKKLTNRIIEAGKLLDIRVLDHVVIADKQFFSFADQAML
jgi:DNA repair protein RadC